MTSPTDLPANRLSPFDRGPMYHLCAGFLPVGLLLMPANELFEALLQLFVRHFPGRPRARE